MSLIYTIFLDFFFCCMYAIRMIMKKKQKEVLQMDKEPVSYELLHQAITYLDTKLDETEQDYYDFERHELDNYLKETVTDERNTPGARTGMLNRLFKSNHQFRKTGHGKYTYSKLKMVNYISNDHLVAALEQKVIEIEKMTDGLYVPEEFTSEDRRFIYNVQYALDTINNLIKEIKTNSK